MADFSFVAEALKRADEFMCKAPMIFPRLCAYHKCRLVVERERYADRITRHGFRPIYNARLVSTVDDHEIFVYRFYDEMSNARLTAEMLKTYVDGDFDSEDPEFKSSIIKFDSIEELDLQLSVRGY